MFCYITTKIKICNYFKSLIMAGVSNIFEKPSYKNMQVEQNVQTDRWTNNLITRCPHPFQVGGIKINYNFTQ